jgi:hypothetical protein
LRTINLLKTKLAGMLVVALCASFVAPGIAGAQEIAPTDDEYQSTLQVIDEGANNQPPSGEPANEPTAGPAEETATLDNNVGPLPFTGFDVIAMAAVALAVAGLGLALQRAVSREPQQ